VDAFEDEKERQHADLRRNDKRRNEHSEEAITPAEPQFCECVAGHRIQQQRKERDRDATIMLFVTCGRNSYA